MQVEGQRQPGKVEVRKVLKGRMLVEIVGIVEDRHGEIGRVAERAADFEAIGRRRMDGGCRRESIEASQMNRAIGL